MRFSVVETYPIRLDTSVGVVSGELWSDQLLGIGLESPTGEAIADADAVVSDAAEVGELLAQVGVPREEAFAVAATAWAEEIAPMLGIWEERQLRERLGRERGLIARWRRRGRR
ncbi:MAG: hypothetical protein M3310_02680 [Actinomycetota bacterium]|nr:hypothetical protein [Actinomycetota bacterium]